MMATTRELFIRYLRPESAMARSQILHGTHYKRIMSFQTERGYAAVLGRLALIECALRLVGYEGTQPADAFRTIRVRS
jgi:hypothetical protein